MKKHLFIVLCCFCFFGKMEGQDSISRKPIGLIVKADILLPVLALTSKYTEKQASLTIEKTIGKRQSIQLTGIYLYYKYEEPNVYFSSASFESKRTLIIPEYKFFILKRKVCSGPYVGSYFTLMYEAAKGNVWHDGVFYPTNTDYYYYYSFSLGAITGFQYCIKNRFVFDFLIGFGGERELKNLTTKSNSTSINNGDFIPSWNLDGRFAINIGYKF